jgi:HlyD family secretion protein
MLSACSDRNHATNLPVSGTIEADEAHVGSRYGGRLVKILAREGDMLKAGDVIVQLEARELAARREQLAAVLADLEAGARPEELAVAKGDWESMAAELAFVQADAKRAGDLFRQNTIAESERDRVVSREAGLEKSVSAAKARHDLLLAGARPERIVQARAQLAEINGQLHEMTVVAPTNCVLEVLAVKVGDVVAPNREVATLLLPHLWVRVFVPEPWLGHIKPGDPVKVRVDSFADMDFPGTVEQVSRVAEFTPRNVQTAEERIRQVFGVKVRLPETDDRLRAGMAADVVFPNVPGQSGGAGAAR